MQIKNTQAFYCGNPCTVLVDLNKDEALIEIMSHLLVYSGGYQEPDYAEPEYSKLVVNKKYLSTTKNTVEEKVQEEFEELLRVKKEDLKIIQEEIESLSKKRDDYDKVVKEFEKSMPGMDKLLSFIKNEFEYFFIHCSHSPRFRTKHELQEKRFTIKTAKGYLDDKEIDLLIEDYNGGYQHSPTKVIPFKTKDELISYIEKNILLAQDEYSTPTIQLLESLFPDHEKLSQAKEKINQKNQQHLLDKRDELQQQLEKLNKKINLTKKN